MHLKIEMKKIKALTYEQAKETAYRFMQREAFNLLEGTGLKEWEAFKSAVSVTRNTDQSFNVTL